MLNKRALMTAGYRTLYTLGRHLHDGGITILCYHSLDDFGTGISVPPGLFARQMATLAAERANTLTMSQVAEHLAARQPFAPRSVAITFDDGFANFASEAAPILARYGFNATIYTISGMVGRATSWTDHGHALPSLPLLTWEQLRELDGAGFEIGAHTVSHGFLSEYRPDELRRELVSSRKTLEQELGSVVKAFAYPQGDYNAAVVAAVRAAGYTSAVTLDQGRAWLNSSPMRLPRLYVGNNTTPDVLRAFLVPTIGPAYQLINLIIRGAMGRKRWPGPTPGTIQSTETAPLEVIA